MARGDLALKLSGRPRIVSLQRPATGPPAVELDAYCILRCLVYVHRHLERVPGPHPIPA